MRIEIKGSLGSKVGFGIPGVEGSGGGSGFRLLRFRVYLEAVTLARFLGYLFLWLGSVVLKSRRPKKGVGKG